MPIAGPAVAVAAADTHALRRAVLRRSNPAAVVTFEGDDEPTTFHLGVVGPDGAPVAVASFFARASPVRPGRRATQLRGMAVSPARQGQGLGAGLLAAGVGRARGRGDEVLWANARDTAVGFYERLGWSVVGAGFVDATTGLPHHVVVLDLTT